MAVLTCPHPANINPLRTNGFNLSIQKIPEVTFFCQSAGIPQVSFGETHQANPFIDVKMPGDKLEYSPLSIRFMIDEEMKNYLSILNRSEERRVGKECRLWCV